MSDISSEGIAGHPANAFADTGANLQRLAELQPGIRVVFITRNPVDFYASLYCHAVANGQHLPPLSYLTANVDAPAQYLKLQSPTDYRALPLIEIVRCIHARFGPDNCLIMPYERIVDDADSWAKQILEFAGVPTQAITIDRQAVHSRLTHTQLTLQTTANRLYARRAANGAPMPLRVAYGAAAKVATAAAKRAPGRNADPFTPAIRRMIRTEHENCNRDLNLLLGGKLDGLGYW